MSRRIPRGPEKGGFTYVALLAVIVIIGITLAATGKYWQNVTQREKEEELLFRGDQYRHAIEKYATAIKGQVIYPQNIDDLLRDNRTAVGKRYLRRKYKDPISGEDFELIRDESKGNRITGVFSKSGKEPLKQSGFSEEDKDFEGMTKYSDWKFIYEAPQAGPHPLPGHQPHHAPPTSAP